MKIVRTELRFLLLAAPALTLLIILTVAGVSLGSSIQAITSCTIRGHTSRAVPWRTQEATWTPGSTTISVGARASVTSSATGVPTNMMMGWPASAPDTS